MPCLPRLSLLCQRLSPIGWRVRSMLVLGMLVLACLSLRAEVVPTLSNFLLQRSEAGVSLDFSVNFELPRSVEDALHKGVPLYFVARAELMRDRWYWRDKRVASAERTWRLAYQPLTRKYRVSFGALHQTFDSLPEALGAVRGAVGWRLAEAGELDDGAEHHVDFVYQLDTSLLPRPMQIGIGGQPDWALRLERRQPLE